MAAPDTQHAKVLHHLHRAMEHAERHRLEAGEAMRRHLAARLARLRAMEGSSTEPQANKEQP